MHPIVRNILAVILGVFGGGALNMGIILISSSVIPPPEGTNLTTMEGLVSAMAIMEPKHFLMPFLAHALGTLVGAVIAALVAANRKILFAYIIGGWFMIGGILNIVMLPSPLWFTIVDLTLAYIPMAFIATKLVVKKQTA